MDLEAAKVLKMQSAGETLEYGKVQDLVSKYFDKAEDVINFLNYYQRHS